MKPGLKVAGAIGVGYLLGRKHKMRTAFTLGAAAAAGQLGHARELLKDKAKEGLTSSENLGALADPGKRLLDAGKSAAVAAVASRMGAMSDELHERAEAVRTGDGKKTEKSEAAASGDKEGGAGESKGKKPEAEKDEGEEVEGKDAEREQTASKESKGKGSKTKETKAKKTPDKEAEDEEPEAEEEEDEEAEDEEPEAEEPKSQRAGKSSSTREKAASGAPVRRKGK
jgi:hypothetical protein